MATRFARRASDVVKSDPVVNARNHEQHFILSTGERRNSPFFVLGEFVMSKDIDGDLPGVANKSEFCSNISSGSGKQHFDMKKYIKQPTPNEMSRWRNAMENIGIRVSPNIKNEFSSSCMCSFCGMDDAARHSGPIDTTLTVIITLPAKARLKDIVDGLTFLLPLIRNLFLLPLLPAMSLSLSEMFSASSSTGWQKTIRAPRQVDMPAMVESRRGVHPASVSMLPFIL
ncbi:hypothetical protein ACHAWT_010861 [Skeletonema menzelii]